MYKNPVLDQLDEHAIAYLREVKRKKGHARREIRALERQILEVWACRACTCLSKS